MASPTTNKGYTYPAHGGSVNSWDTPIDADFDQIDLNVGGTYNITATSTTGATTFNSTVCTCSNGATSITFPTSIAQNMYYNVTGSFSGTCTLNYPAAGSFYIVNNQLSGGTLKAAPSGGTSVTIVGVNLIVSDGGTMWSGRPGAEFASGTTIIFNMSAAPANWTEEGGFNDQVLRIVNGAGRGTGGAWTISGLSVGNHTLVTNEIPSHNHSYNDSFVANLTGIVHNTGNGSANDGIFSDTTGSAGGGAAHNHGISADGSWRPAYVNVISASKN